MVDDYARALWLDPLVGAYVGTPLLAGGGSMVQTSEFLDAVKAFVSDNKKALPRAYASRVTEATPEADQVLYFALVHNYTAYLDVVKPQGQTLMAVTDSLGNTPLHIALELIGDPEFRALHPFPPEQAAHTDLHPLYLALITSILVDPAANHHTEEEGGGGGGGGQSSSELAAHLSIPNGMGDTLVHTAAAHNLVPVLRSLISHGCNPEVPNGQGENATHIAVEASQVDSIRVLIRLGYGGTHALEWALEKLNMSKPLFRALHGLLGNAKNDAFKGAVRKSRHLKAAQDAVGVVLTLLEAGSSFDPAHIEAVVDIGSVDVLRGMVVFGRMSHEDGRFKPALASLVETIMSAPPDDPWIPQYFNLLQTLVAAGLDTKWLISSDESILAHEELLNALLAFAQVPLSEPEAAELSESYPEGDTNVLALDGGGIRGLILVEMLTELMNEARSVSSRGEELEVWDLFDVFCGTSTGGILALALGIRRLDLGSCSRLYFDFAADVFGEFEPLYNPSKLEAIVNDVIGEDVSMRDFPASRVFVVSTDVTTSPSTFVLRNYAPDSPFAYNGTSSASVTDAVLATAAAPTFFPAHKFVDPDTGVERVLADGALVYNSPSIPALMETSSMDVAHLVNLGTGCLLPGAPHTVEDYSPRVIPKIIHSKHEGSTFSKLTGTLLGGKLGGAEVSAFRNCIDAIMEASFGGDETQPIRYMASRQATAFSRFNPVLTSAALDEGNIIIIVGLLWESRTYIRSRKPLLVALAQSLVRSKGL